MGFCPSVREVPMGRLPNRLPTVCGLALDRGAGLSGLRRGVVRKRPARRTESPSSPGSPAADPRLVLQQPNRQRSTLRRLQLLQLRPPLRRRRRPQPQLHPDIHQSRHLPLRRRRGLRPEDARKRHRGAVTSPRDRRGPPAMTRAVPATRATPEPGHLCAATPAVSPTRRSSESAGRMWIVLPAPLARFWPGTGVGSEAWVPA